MHSAISEIIYSTVEYRARMVLGIPATLLIEAIFNGVLYGVIAWQIFTVASRLMEKS